MGGYLLNPERLKMNWRLRSYNFGRRPGVRNKCHPLETRDNPWAQGNMDWPRRPGPRISTRYRRN